LRMPNSTTQITTTAAPTAIAKSSKSTWYQVPAHGRSTRAEVNVLAPSRRCRGPAASCSSRCRYRRAVCAADCACALSTRSRTCRHATIAGRLLLIPLRPLRIDRLAACPEHRTHPNAADPQTATRPHSPVPAGPTRTACGRLHRTQAAPRIVRGRSSPDKGRPRSFLGQAAPGSFSVLLPCPVSRCGPCGRLCGEGVNPPP